MMRRFCLLMGVALFTAWTLSSCSSNDNDDSQNNTESPGNSGGGEGGGPGGDPSNMTYAQFSGVIYGSYGSKLGGVTVTSGTNTVKSASNGLFQLSEVNIQEGNIVVNFAKKGYISTARTAPADGSGRLDVVMVLAQRSPEFPAPSGSTVTVPNTESPGSGSMRIDLPAGGYKDSQGNEYTGMVKVDAAYLTPDAEDFANAMPGNLSAVRFDNSPVQLVSWGMVAVQLLGDNDQKLQLTGEKKAKLTFPIPDKFRGTTLPDSIPLWTFNETKGLWEEEGVARLDGTNYVGEVSHFSWHNLDTYADKATLKVNVKDSQGNALSYVPVDIDGQRKFYTNANGMMKCDVPSNTDLYVRIPSEGYGNYADNNPSLDQKQTLRLSGGETKEITFTIPSRCPVISGVVTNTGGGSNICTVSIVYGWNQTKATMSDLKGAYKVYAPSDYRGTATLVAAFADGTKAQKEFTITNDDQRIDLTASSSGSSNSGAFTVSNADGINATYALPTAEDGGLMTGRVDGNMFMVQMDKLSTDNKGRESFNFEINNYDSGNPQFREASFYYMIEGGPVFYVSASCQGTITRNGNVYNIRLSSSDAYFTDQMIGIESAEVSLSAEFSVKAE